MAKVKAKKKKVSNTLTNEEMLKIDNNNLELKVKESEIKILRLQKELAMRQLDEKIVVESRNIEMCLKRSKDFNSELKERLSITTEKWGFDPITGVIHE